MSKNTRMWLNDMLQVASRKKKWVRSNEKKGFQIVENSSSESQIENKN